MKKNYKRKKHRIKTLFAQLFEPVEKVLTKQYHTRQCLSTFN